jgi:hypothetical protein
LRPRKLFIFDSIFKVTAIITSCRTFKFPADARNIMQVL